MNRTRWFIVLIGVLVTVFDAWTVNTQGYDTTISWQLYTWGKEWPIIPFLIGGLFFHIFMPNRAAK